jgi:D-arabinitol dehydrogenase (NADP+)
MKAVVYTGPLQWTLADVARPDPGLGEVLLRVAASGLCGTDSHLHRGEFGPVYPLTPGHEIAGHVEALGPDVTSLQLGELVALDNMMACGFCPQCRRARPQFCAAMRAMGVTDPGGFAEYVVAPAGKCYPAGDLSPDAAVFAEPTACVVHGLDVLGMRPGSDVLVFGTGPTGLILTQLLRHSGAARVTVAGRTRFKLDIAAAGGADEIVLLGRSDPDANDRHLRDLAPNGFDVVVDATGTVEILSRCPALTGIGGTVLVYGMTDENARWPVDSYDIFRRELRIIGSFSQSYSFDRAVSELRNGRVRTEGLITHRFSLDEYGTAIQTLGTPDCLKAVIQP